MARLHAHFWGLGQESARERGGFWVLQKRLKYKGHYCEMLNVYVCIIVYFLLLLLYLASINEKYAFITFLLLWLYYGKEAGGGGGGHADPQLGGCRPH